VEEKMDKMMYTPEMFLYPDGSLMDAADIALMLNDGEEPCKLKVETTKYTQIGVIKVPVIRAIDIGFYGDRPATQITAVDVPRYKENFIEIFDQIARKNLRENIYITTFAVGYDIYINLDEQAQLYRSTESNIGFNELAVHVSSGRLNFKCTMNAGEITPLYNTYKDAMRML
jgi:hypothetical protein